MKAATKRTYPSLAAFLRDTGTSQAAFAKIAGVSQPVISRIANGKQYSLDVTIATRIAQLANVPVESLTTSRRRAA